MRRRLASFFALLLCITYSITFGVTSVSATYKTLEELPIDPAGDLADIRDKLPDFSQGLLPALPEREPEVVDPYLGDVSSSSGPAFFSMNDYDTLRTFTVRAGSILFGHGAFDNNSELVEGDTLSLTSQNGTNAIMVVELENKRSGTYGYIESGTIVDIEASFDASADNVLRISGSGSMSLMPSASTIGPPMYPDTVAILVNGIVLTTPVSVNDAGVFAFSEGEYELTSDVETVGYRFSFDTSKSSVGTTGSSTSSYSLLLQFSDQAAWEFVESEPEYNGILNAIVGWLTNLWDAIVSLPGKIANLILDGISALFLPSEDDILELQDKYARLLDTRLGFIYETFDWLFNFFGSLVEVFMSSDGYEFTFPGISVPMNGESIVIIEETPVSLDNAVMNVLRPVCGTIVSLVAVVGVAHVLFEMVAALVSGTSYFEYLKRGRDNDAD